MPASRTRKDSLLSPSRLGPSGVMFVVLKAVPVEAQAPSAPVTIS